MIDGDAQARGTSDESPPSKPDADYLCSPSSRKNHERRAHHHEQRREPRHLQVRDSFQIEDRHDDGGDEKDEPDQAQDCGRQGSTSRSQM